MKAPQGGTIPASVEMSLVLQVKKSMKKLMAELWSMKKSVFEQSSWTSTCKLSRAQGIEYWIVCGSGWLYPDTDKWSMFSTFICKKKSSKIFFFFFLTQLRSVSLPGGCRMASVEWGRSWLRPGQADFQATTAVFALFHMGSKRLRVKNAPWD